MPFSVSSWRMWALVAAWILGAAAEWALYAFLSGPPSPGTVPLGRLGEWVLAVAFLAIPVALVSVTLAWAVEGIGQPARRPADEASVRDRTDAQ